MTSNNNDWIRIIWDWDWEAQLRMEFALPGLGPLDKPSFSSKWGGTRQQLSEVDSLSMVVDFLWNCYEERHPTPTETRYLCCFKQTS